MRTHPPTLITLARRALLGPCRLNAGSHVLVAVSGGPDSMALLHACCILLSKGVLGAVSAHGVDHGLRPEAAAELDLGRALAERHGVPFSTTRVQVSPGPNVQARARTARYEALGLAKQRAGADVIATAHHRDDRAETVLIRILRGAPLAGLGVLPAREGDRIRPLIDAGRADVLAHIGRHHLDHAEDPSNRSPRFLRTRVRSEVLPLLSQLSPRITEHLAELAESIVASNAAALASKKKGRAEEPFDVRVESKRAMSELARLRASPQTNRAARVSLKGGVVLSVTGVQALKDIEGEIKGSEPSKKNDSEP
jgi:tRNA(Ile)-lysidine synthase